jgi:hypothetical protein
MSSVLNCSRDVDLRGHGDGHGRHSRPDDPHHRRDSRVQRVHEIGNLALWDEHLRARRLVQPVVSAITHDADDLAIRLARELAHAAAADHKVLADRIGVRPELLGHGFVDDDDRRSSLRIAVGEGASADDRDLEDLEVSR